MTENKEICPACGVTIEDNIVLFSFGKPGTRERLYARVCQYAKKQGCINKNVIVTDLIENDYYTLPNNLSYSIDSNYTVLGDS